MKTELTAIADPPRAVAVAPAAGQLAGIEQPVPRFDLAALRTVLGLYAASRLVILAVAALSRLILVKGAYVRPGSSLLERFNTWDAGWYLQIASKGYSFVPDAESNVAFYPLYPMLIRAVSWTGLDFKLSGYLISNAALLGAAALLWLLAARESRSRAVADRAVLFLMFCPGSFWFSMIYSESIFLLTLTGCLLFARRKSWLAAGCCGYLVALARPPGLFAGIFLALEAWQQWRERRAELIGTGLMAAGTRHWAAEARTHWRVALGVIAPGLGHATQLLFYQLSFGDWRAQQLAAKAGWGVGGFRLPWQAIIDNWAWVEPFYLWLAYPMLAVFLGLGLIAAFSLRRWGYAAIALALMTLYVCTATTYSLPRYLCTTVPVFLVLGQLAARSRTLELAVFGLSVGLLSLLVALLANGYMII